MTSRKLVGRGVKWSAGVALLLGCGATDGANPSLATNDDGFGRSAHQPAPPPRGHGQGHGPGHHSGHGHGHGHGHPGQPGAGGSSSSGGSSGSSSSAGQSSGSGAATSTGGTFGSAGFSSGGSAGAYDPGVCGDGQVRGYESCDDGNTLDGDGCDATCAVEPGFTCPWGEPCRVVACGDGFTDGYPNEDGFWEYEQCDDGNTTSGDGCSATCEPEPGFMCFTPGSPCKDVVCGDGAADPYYVLIEGTGGTAGTGGFGSGGSGVAGAPQAGAGPVGPYIGYAYEGCDDGNTVSGDGCTAACEPESGWICDHPGEPCRQPRCGDGYIDFIPGTGGAGGTSGSGGVTGDTGGFGGMAGGSFGTFEECDDGNGMPGDGCSASCGIEAGYSCPESGVPCKLAVCGDGIVDYPVEDCDDGNTTSGDYCDSNCHYEFGSGGSAGFPGVGGSFTAGTGAFPAGGSAGAYVGGRGGQSASGR